MSATPYWPYWPDPDLAGDSAEQYRVDWACLAPGDAAAETERLVRLMGTLVRR